jgi:alpha-1,2-mannosyltransferase
MMWIAAGTLLSIRHKALAGFAFGAAILTRPHTALVAACNGLWQSAKDRSPRPAFLIGIGSCVGLATLIVFNNAIFGSASISGGYGGSFANRATSWNVLDYAGNVLLALVHPIRGVLVYSPFLIPLLIGLPAAWKAAPSWVRGSAVGGLLYLLLQLKANRYSGGAGFWAYRYPLETLAAAAPLLLLSYTQWVTKQSDLTRKLFRWLLLVSVLFTAIGAIFF